jgi:4-amino-4-deoxy-L-arabinose transferase-like glycosyltransferase
MGLTPQEAYYWEWGRRLDLSYFDHPPLASWTIRAFTGLLGDGLRAIRLAAALHSGLFLLFFFLATRRLFGARAALLALALGLSVPLLSLGQVVITPDGPLLSGWAMALYFTVRALDEDDGRWLLGAGAAAGWAVLGKYTGFLLLPQILLALLLDPRGRRMLRGPWPWLGAALAVAVMSPVLLWNLQHAGASFEFQTAGRARSSGGFRLVRVGRFVGLQALLVTPVLLVLLVEGAVRAGRRWREAPFRIAALFSLPLLGLAAVLSPFTWVKGNWLAAAYPAALAAAAALAVERGGWRRTAAAWGAGLGVLVSVYVHLVPLVPALPFSARDELSTGWDALAARVEAERGAVTPAAPVIGCSYKVAAQLAFHLPERPGTQMGGVFGGNGLQYDLWLDRGALAGKDLLVVRDRRERDECAAKAAWCEAVEPLEPLTVLRGAAVVTTFELARCRGYRGAPAPAPGGR